MKFLGAALLQYLLVVFICGVVSTVFQVLVLAKLAPLRMQSPYYPVAPLIAVFLGFAFDGKFRSEKSGIIVWVIGVVWLTYGFFDMKSGWSSEWSSASSDFVYATQNLFGSTEQCSSTECLGELVYTMPGTAAIAYSLGVAISKV